MGFPPSLLTICRSTLFANVCLPSVVDVSLHVETLCSLLQIKHRGGEREGLEEESMKLEARKGLSFVYGVNRREGPLNFSDVGEALEDVASACALADCSSS
jgi:hypothetical protein